MSDPVSGLTCARGRTPPFAWNVEDGSITDQNPHWGRECVAIRSHCEHSLTASALNSTVLSEVPGQTPSGNATSLLNIRARSALGCDICSLQATSITDVAQPNCLRQDTLTPQFRQVILLTSEIFN